MATDARALSLFSRVESCWGSITDGAPGAPGPPALPTLPAPPAPPAPPDTNRIPQYLATTDSVPFPFPVVAVVDRHAPGHIVLQLRAIPWIKTVGEASAPVLAPTRPFMLSDGTWVHRPHGVVFAPSGEEIIFLSVEPDVFVPPGISVIDPIRKALEMLGAELDKEPSLCRWRASRKLSDQRSGKVGSISSGPSRGSLGKKPDNNVAWVRILIMAPHFGASIRPAPGIARMHDRPSCLFRNRRRHPQRPSRRYSPCGT